MILASGISSGVGIAKAQIFKKGKNIVPYHAINNVDDEFFKVDYCFEKTNQELGELYNILSMNSDSGAIRVVDKYLKAINSHCLIDDIKKKIRSEGLSAEYAIFSIMEEFITMIKGLDDEYLCEKSEDINEIKSRLLSKLMGSDFEDCNSIDCECIVVAEELTPWDVLRMNTSYVKGIITIQGGPTSSAGIMARYMNIPAVTGAGHEGGYIKNGDLLIVDGNLGKVLINPDYDEITAYGTIACNI